ncbi:MAG: 50S ribosomal protein L30 [Alphaproteobacteria bacterium GWF2_58_20]|nr:MAG: 50S ribosomal protein L30 [Alphaproteobacteria bacterium GWF2_58_20]
MPKTLKVTQTGSKSGATVRQIKSLVGLGLGKIGKMKMLEDTSAVRGLVAKVQHLIKVETTK